MTAITATPFLTAKVHFIEAVIQSHIKLKRTKSQSIHGTGCTCGLTLLVKGLCLEEKDARKGTSTEALYVCNLNAQRRHLTLTPSFREAMQTAV